MNAISKPKEILTHLQVNQPSHDEFSEILKNLSARVCQVVFTTGIFFSLRSGFIAAGTILSGGAFLCPAIFSLYTVFEAVICYDISRLMANFASIHDSPWLRTKAEATFGKVAGDTVKVAEDFFAIPNDLKQRAKKDSGAYINVATTYNTVFLRFAEPQITKLIRGESRLPSIASQTLSLP